jgi:hypothetical protein
MQNIKTTLKTRRSHTTATPRHTIPGLVKSGNFLQRKQIVIDSMLVFLHIRINLVLPVKIYQIKHNDNKDFAYGTATPAHQKLASRGPAQHHGL